MAKLILDDSYPSKVSSSYSWWKISLVGAGMGSLYWFFTMLIRQFIVEPIFCGSSLNVEVCSNAVGVSGNLANIFIAVIGLTVLIKIATPRPLIVSVATMVVLWDLAGWTNGLAWAEIVAWEAVLFVASYLLFSWIGRYTRSVSVIVVTLIAVIGLRIMAVL